MQQEAQRDAPDPRESRPPCYSDAIRMPRLDAFASLNELRLGKNKRRRKTENEDEEIDENVPLRRNRCRSEEVLSMRSTVAENGGILVPRIHPFEGEMRDTQTFSDEEQNEDDASESFEEIRNFDQSANTLNDGSPYAKRKQLAENNRKTNKGASSSSSNQTEQAGPSTPQQPIVIHDDHFKNDIKTQSNNNNSTIEEHEGSNEFITFEIKRNTDIFVPRPDNNDNDQGGSGARPTSI